MDADYGLRSHCRIVGSRGDFLCSVVHISLCVKGEKFRIRVIISIPITFARSILPDGQDLAAWRAN
jgi:hypothetical protein